MSAGAIAHYHDLLTDGGLAADSQDRLDRLQEARGLFFGDRPVCTVLRPRFLTPDQYRFLRGRVKALLPALQTVYDRAIADPAFRRLFRLLDWEEQLLAIDPGYPVPHPTSRLDAFFTPGRELWFTEYNTETPAGAGYSDALADVFYGLPVFQEFQRRYHVFPVPAKPGVLHALLDSYDRWRGLRADPPRVAILDWREVPTFREFVLIYDYLKGFGIEARNVDPRDVEYADGKLMAGDYHITLIYKRVLLSDLIDRGGIDHPVVRAVRDGAVCMVNSFRCKVLAKKASFAALSDERNADLFTAEQHRAIADHVPWTRVVEERKTMYDGRAIDLMPFAAANKDRFLLKPNDDTGGHGIVRGWAVDRQTWDRALQAALAEPFVIQQRVSLPTEPYPCVRDGRLEFRDRVQDTDPYVAFGSYAHGCLTRVSTAEPVNVAAGGGSVVPTFLIEER
ncbi:MAG TPA: hypothetical protein VFG68_20460 [Fimbriiglobus sp.]|nr:hypothetical protein [Fimbriiglobus sp.]